jgi:hypothetical protein
MKSIVVSASEFMTAAAKLFEALRREPWVRICSIKSASLGLEIGEQGTVGYARLLGNRRRGRAQPLRNDYPGCRLHDCITFIFAFWSGYDCDSNKE